VVHKCAYVNCLKIKGVTLKPTNFAKCSPVFYLYPFSVKVSGKTIMKFLKMPSHLKCVAALGFKISDTLLTHTG